MVLVVSHVERLRRRQELMASSHRPKPVALLVGDSCSWVIGDSGVADWRLDASVGWTALRIRRSGGGGPWRGSSMLSTCVRLSCTTQPRAVGLVLNMHNTIQFYSSHGRRNRGSRVSQLLGRCSSASIPPYFVNVTSRIIVTYNLPGFVCISLLCT